MDDDAPLTTPDEAPTTSDAMPSWHANGSTNGLSTASSTTSTTDPAATDVAPDDEDAAFLSELARAMKGAAAAERARVAEDTDRRRADHIAAIHARRDSEAQRIRELAEQDRKGIDAWAEAELQRIQQERERRTTGVEDDLQKSLAEHRTRIEWEIARVEEAIRSYRSDVDAFFASLDHETDPVTIAQHAGRRPTFPALDSLTATAVATTTAPETEAPDSKDTPTASTTAADTATDADTTVSTGDAEGVEPVAVGPGLDGQDEVVADADQPAAEAENSTAADSGPDVPDVAPVAIAADEVAAEPTNAIAESADAPASPAAEPAETQVSAVAETVAPTIDTSPETTGIGVMEPLSSQKLAEAWAAWNRSTAVVDPRLAEARRAVEQAEGDAAAEANAEVASTRPAGAYLEPGEAVGAAASGENRSGAPFSTGPGFARMSWLRRDKDHSSS
ncbi:MAG TPA: hypothetical protein VFP22_00510 [Candidatus Limnocylindrales bacterium]|nr:hypothetical protein [Candidatus Limnocylindrales bacterium]